MGKKKEKVVSTINKKYFWSKYKTMSIKERVAELLPKMSAEDKVWLYHEITGIGTDTFPGIEKTPGVVGGSACIIRTRIPVWTLVSYKNNGLSDEDLLANYPSLREQDLINAWNYYLAQKEEIESEIIANEAV